MTLFHFTSLEALGGILADQQIKTTCSNLLRPVAPRLIGGNVVDPTDSYRPVVWFTDAFNPEGNGLEAPSMFNMTVDKTEVAIVIKDAYPPVFQKWSKWAKKHKIEEEWFTALKKTAPNWRHFYVSEKPVLLSDKTKIIVRSDIVEKSGIDISKLEKAVFA